MLHSGKGFPAIGRRPRWLDGEEKEVHIKSPILLVKCRTLHRGLDKVHYFGFSRQASQGWGERLLDMGRNALHRLQAQGTHRTQVGQNRAVGDAIVVERNLNERVSLGNSSSILEEYLELERIFILARRKGVLVPGRSAGDILGWEDCGDFVEQLIKLSGRPNTIIILPPIRSPCEPRAGSDRANMDHSCRAESNQRGVSGFHLQV